MKLPSDVEPFLTDGYDQLHDPAVYALRLSRRPNVADLWDARFDTRPEWFDKFLSASGVVYVGATADCLSRLEDHEDGEVRQTSILKVCDIHEIRNIWFFVDKDRAFERESGLAIELRNAYPDLFVHQN